MLSFPLLLLALFSTSAVAQQAAPGVSLTLSTPGDWTSNGPNKLSFSLLSDTPATFDIILINQSKQFFGDSLHQLVLTRNQPVNETGVQNEIVVFPVNATEVPNGPQMLSSGEGYQISLIAHTRTETGTNPDVTSSSDMFSIADSPSPAASATNSETKAAKSTHKSSAPTTYSSRQTFAAIVPLALLTIVPSLL